MNYAIFLSGGIGQRANTNLSKQYIKAGGFMMTSYALTSLLSSEYIDKVCIVADKVWQNEIVLDARKKNLDIDKIIGFAVPGDNRQLSILNGLYHIVNNYQEKIVDTDTVLIHDAARPFLSVELIKRCYKNLIDHDGVMPVIPMKDTVYYSENGKTVSKLLERNKIYAGQAPELFRLNKYYKANLELLPDKILMINGASEAALLNKMDIVMIDGDNTNLKVTTKEDVDHYRMVFDK